MSEKGKHLRVRYRWRNFYFADESLQSEFNCILNDIFKSTFLKQARERLF